MRVLVFSGSRSDRCGLEHVHDALGAAGHESWPVSLYAQAPATASAAIGIAQHALEAIKEAAGAPFDWALLGGDRYETLASGLACSIAGIPIAHLAGGDSTYGSRDDAYRDALTALADLHLATNARAYDRLAVLDVRGEIVQTGSPAIDRILGIPTCGRQAICDKLGVCNQAVLIACVHPNTDGGDPLRDFVSVIAALHERRWDYSVVWIGANADVGGQDINVHAQKALAEFPSAVFKVDLPVEDFCSLMANASMMVGNSSAGIIEAPSFGLPVVNVGNRQQGRMRGANVYDCNVDRDEIVATIRKADRGGRFDEVNPYGDGKSTERIIQAMSRRRA